MADVTNVKSIGDLAWYDIVSVDCGGSFITFMSTKWQKVRHIFLVCFGLLALGCATTDQKPDALTPVEPVQVQVEKSGPSLYQRMLAQAETLFNEGKLIAPEEDNAYIRYRALQLLYPDSRDAQSGLDAILVNEIDVARTALENNRRRQVRAQLKILEQRFPSAPLIAQFKKNMAQTIAAENTKRQALIKKEREDKPRIFLDADELAARSDAAISELAGIANKVRATDEFIMIYARSDADARWVYQKMRDAVPGYRIRADIRIGEPSVRLLPPLD